MGDDAAIGRKEWRCEVCHTEYDKRSGLTIGGSTHVFECAIHAVAPTCEHCGCRIIGHGNEAGRRAFWCAHCAREAGVSELHDRGVSGRPLPQRLYVH